MTRRQIVAALTLVLCGIATPSLAQDTGKEFYRQHGTLTIISNGKRYTGHATITLTRKAKVYKLVKGKRGKAARVAAAPVEPVHQWGATSALVAQARADIGKTAHQIAGLTRTTLWCAEYMNQKLRQIGYRGTNSNLARSFASYGRRVAPQVGAIAVMSRGRRGGHVGVVSGFDARGNPIIISGNHNRRVAESVYPRSRVYAYVMP